jgi:hypothetical protein
MLYHSHYGVELYKQAYELTRNLPPEQQCRIALHFDPASDRRRYQTPHVSVDEIAVLLIGSEDQPADSQDIVLYRRDGPPLRIYDTNPLYPSLRYILLFPTGQLGWHQGLPYRHPEDVAPRENNEDAEPTWERHISPAEYLRYRLHIRPIEVESNHLFLSGKLF